MPRNVVLFIFLVLLVCAGVFLFTEQVTAPTTSISDRPQDTPYTEEAYQNRRMDISTYVSANIATLSPVQETLGGKFFVTQIQADNGEGVVTYEDGHAQYIADFTYRESAEGGYEITKFKVRQR